MEDVLRGAYKKSTKRLFLLDYDGTLRDLEPLPDRATPTPEIKQLLYGLAENPANTVVIVSGRDREVLERWFGDMPLYFVAEHGLSFRDPDQGWQFAPAPSVAWRTPVQKIMEQSVAAVPGSHIEAKSNSLVWHYRAAEQPAALAERAKLLAALSPLVEQYHLRIFASEKSKAIDVQPEGSDKGNSIRRWFNLDEYDFILAAGDDLTDEDLFRAMPPRAFTIKVGEDETIAKSRLPDPAAVRKTLSLF